MQEIWIVKGEVTDPDAYDGKAKVGDVEWQFSDGPPGERGSSSDFLTLEEGLAYHSGAVFHWHRDNPTEQEILAALSDAVAHGAASRCG